MKVESSATPLLTGYKASSLPGQVCPFHPLSTLELEEKANGFGYVPCPEKMCFTFSPASEWKEDIEWIAFHTLSDLKQYPTQLICDCSKKPALRKTKKSLIKDRIFLACYNIECNFFMWRDQYRMVWSAASEREDRVFLAVLDFVWFFFCFSTYFFHKKRKT